MRERATVVVLVTVALLATPLTGCLDTDGDTDVEWSSYEEAKTASGSVFSPNETSPIRLKWLQPSTPDDVPQGQSSIFFLLYHTETDEPVTNAEISLSSRMPAMGHGTAAEEDPTHESYGVYKGIINPSMGGAWVLNLQVTLSDGTTLGFQIDYTATDGSGAGHTGDGDVPTFDSFQEAMDANGTEIHPEDENQSIRLKLLHPAEPHVDGPGQHPVVFLLYDHDAQEPVENETLALESWMPPHATEGGGHMSGHGTGSQEETDPTHQGHGVYKGAIHPVMNGTWLLNITQSPDGEATLLFSFEYEVGGEHGGHMGHGDEETRTAELTANQTNGTVPLSIAFEASATGLESSHGDHGSNASASWMLAFGDGNETRGNASDLPATLNHTYEQAGNLTATLTVTYSDNATRTAEVNLSLSEAADTGSEYVPRHKEWVDAAAYGVPWGFTGAEPESTASFVKTSIDSGANGTYVLAYNVDVSAGISNLTVTANAEVLATDPVFGIETPDYDVYIYAPDGSHIGTSANGGTNERVTILDPEPGVYLLGLLYWAGADSPEASQAPVTITADAT